MPSSRLPSPHFRCSRRTGLLSSPTVPRVPPFVGATRTSAGEPVQPNHVEPLPSGPNRAWDPAGNGCPHHHIVMLSNTLYKLLHNGSPIFKRKTTIYNDNNIYQYIIILCKNFKRRKNPREQWNVNETQPNESEQTYQRRADLGPQIPLRHGCKPPPKNFVSKIK